MLYQILLGVGFVGILAQVALGFVHTGHVGGAHSHSATHSHSANSARGHHSENSIPAYLLWFTPLRLFSWSLGAGATGMLLQTILKNPLLTGILAIVTGFVFYLFIIQPLFTIVTRFSSPPAQNLNGSVGTEAIADSRFDEKGHGIVKLYIDRQQVRLFATLDTPTDVKPGERLMVIAIDATKNTCQVARI